MPYFFITDLPEMIQKQLPKKAQEIQRRALNRVWDNHRDPATLPKGETRVWLAAKIAWHEVKKKYKKWGKHWVIKKNVNSKLLEKPKIKKEKK